MAGDGHATKAIPREKISLTTEARRREGWGKF
jgi:hypothetical protein